MMIRTVVKSFSLGISVWLLLLLAGFLAFRSNNQQLALRTVSFVLLPAITVCGFLTVFKYKEINSLIKSSFVGLILLLTKLLLDISVFGIFYQMGDGILGFIELMSPDILIEYSFLLLTPVLVTLLKQMLNNRQN